MKISVIMASALVLLVLPGYAFAAPSIVTSLTASVEDGAGGFEELEGPKGVTAVTVGSSTYALVAAYDDDGIQIINITDPNNPTPVASIEDGEDGFEELKGARYVTTVTIDSSTYALVSASADNGVQIINITTPSSPSPVAHVSNAAGLALQDPRGIATLTTGSSTYALVASHDGGVQIINITTPSSPAPVTNVRDGSGGFEALSRARGITTVTLDSSTYALVASYDDGVQIINVTNPSEPAPVAAVLNSQSNRLDGATGITTVTVGSSTYALVAAQNDNAVQIINITDPSSPESVAFAQDGSAGFDRLHYPESITTVTFGSSTYAVVASFLDGIQIINITDPSNPSPAASVGSFDTRFGNFALPEAITAVTIDSKTYVLVASYFSNSVPIIGVDLTFGPVLTSATFDEGTGILETVFSDTVDVTPSHLIDLSKMTVGDFGQSVSLAGATLNTEADSAVISITLTADQGHSVAAMAFPRLDMAASAVRDTSGNPIDSTYRNAVTVIDDAAPEVVSVTLDEGTDTLKITFSDRIDVTPANAVYPGGMTIWGSEQSVSLAGATLNTEADSAVISITLTADQGRSVAALPSPSLEIDRYAVVDTDGNLIESSSGHAISTISVNSVPAVQSIERASPENRITSSRSLVFAVTFSEAVAGVDAADFALSADGTGTGSVSGLTGSGSRYNVTVIATADGTYNLDIVQNSGIADTAGNPLNGTAPAGADESYTVDSALGLAHAPPIAEAGPPQTVNEGSTVTLAGTATDPDQTDTLTYAWSQTSPTSPAVTFGNSSALSTTFTAPQVAANTTFTFTLSVTDGTATATDTVTVTVRDVPDPNTPPTVNAGADQAVDEGDTVTLTGTATDDDDDPLAYRWTHDSSLAITMANDTSLSTTFTAPVATADTTITFTLTVSDGTNDGVTDQVEITVTNNDPPTVNAGADQAVDEGDTVTLAGTATDDDDDPLTYRWTHDSSLAITMANDTSLSTTFTAPAATADTTITFTLTASDGIATASDSMILAIEDVLDTSQPAGAFVTTWQTTQANERITIPVGRATGMYSVDWGDGHMSENVSGNQQHMYVDPGTYTVSISGDFTRIYLDGQQPNADRLQSIDQWGDIKWESMNSAFQGASNVTYRATDAPDLSSVTDMSWMFYGASSFNGDISDWDVSEVTGMGAMFHEAHSFNGDLSAWDVSEVTGMGDMFHGATSFNGDLSAWDVSEVTGMGAMFFEAYSFNGDLSAWDVSEVTDMLAMFHDAISFNGDLSAWDVSEVTGMGGMFHGATSFNGDLSAWDVSEVTDMGAMFHEAHSFSGDLSAWDVSEVTDMGAMFLEAHSFNGDLSAWDVSSITNMHNMFRDADSFNQNLGKWYVVLGDTTIDLADTGNTVGSISAQNSELEGQSPTYGLGSDSVSQKFAIGGNNLQVKSGEDYSGGSYGVTITATGTGLFGTNNDRTVDVTVTNTTQSNNPPTAEAGPAQAVNEGSTVTLTGTATDLDHADTLTHAWSQASPASPAATFGNSSALSTTFTAPQVAANTTFTFTLTADDGTDTHSDTVTVTILDVPVVGTPNRGSDQNTTAVLNPDGPLGPRDIGRITLTSAQPGTIQASWEAPSETPAGYRISWAKAGDPYLTWTDLSGNAFPTDPSRTITDLEESEQYKVMVRATYDGTAGDWSGEITVTVAGSANNPPTADAGTAQAVQEGDAVTLNGTASDQDGDQLTYSWSHDSALDVSLANADSLSSAFTAPQVSANTTVTFTLTADDGTDTHSDTVTVTILDVPVVGTPNRGSDQNTTAVLNPDGPLGPRDIGRITLTSAQPGTIQASWEAPSETPVDYRISWAKAGEPYLTWTDLSGNAFPTDPSRTIADLEEGETYKVMVRARYAGSSGDWSGEITVTVARTG